MLELKPETKIMDLLTELPDSMTVLSSHGMHCMGCLGAGVETIEDSCKMHSIDMAILIAELEQLQKTDIG